jgi:hypothetical protein
MSASLLHRLTANFEKTTNATLAATRSYLTVMGLTRAERDPCVATPNYFNKKYIGEEPQFPPYDAALARTAHLMPRIPEAFLENITLSDRKLRTDYNVRAMDAYAGLFMAHPMHNIILLRKSPHATKAAVSLTDILRNSRQNIVAYGKTRSGDRPPLAETDAKAACYYLDGLMAHVAASKLSVNKIDRLQHAVVQNKTDIQVLAERFVDLAYDVLQLKPS